MLERNIVVPVSGVGSRDTRKRHDQAAANHPLRGSRGVR